VNEWTKMVENRGMLQLADRHEGREVIGLKWVYKPKYNEAIGGEFPLKICQLSLGWVLIWRNFFFWLVISQKPLSTTVKYHEARKAVRLTPEFAACFQTKPFYLLHNGCIVWSGPSGSFLLSSKPYIRWSRKKMRKAYRLTVKATGRFFVVLPNLFLAWCSFREFEP